MQIQSSPASRFRICLNYEDLISDPEYWVPKICESVDIQFNTKLLNAFGELHAPSVDRQVGSASELSDRKSTNFSKKEKWDELIEPSDGQKRALEIYEKIQHSLITAR